MIEELKIISGKDQIRYRGDRGSRTRLWFSLFSVLFVFVLIRNSWCSLHPHTYDQLLFPSPWAYVSLLSPFFVCLFLVYSHKKKVFGLLAKMGRIRFFTKNETNLNFYEYVICIVIIHIKSIKDRMLWILVRSYEL